MIKEQEFFELCEKSNYSKKDINNFREAVEFAVENFKGEKRLSGEPVVFHNISIGIILVKSKISSGVVIAGLLYGLENKVLPSEVEKRFGKDVSDLVFGQNQLKVIQEKNKCAEAEILRKILLATLQDVRIIFVKLASKLDNLKTISVFPAKEQKEIAEEVLELYAPLANRFGLEKIKRQLEDEAFKTINPKKYKEIFDFLKESREEREIFVKKFVDKVRELIENKVNVLRIKGREKHIYSIYKKIVDRKVGLDEQKDHFAIRIIVKSVEDCYNALGILHENFEPVPETLKDFIASPKPNGYQSVHTVLKVFENKIVEVQIRTEEMNEAAEEGTSAHWQYKGLKSDEDFEKKTALLRSVLDLQNTCKDKEVLKNIKLNLFGDRIYCYTPKGKAIEMPQGATLLDFAYYIHQEIGSHAVGGRVNGIFVSLNKKLNFGDVVEIVTNKHQRSRREWLKFVVSDKAISKIRQEIKKYENMPAPKKVSFIKEREEKFDSVVFSPEFPNINFSIARCCSPLPEEEIVAVMKFAKQFSVHSKNCSRLKETKNAIPVFWKETFNKPLLIKVEASNRSGILADILHTIISGKFVVKEAKAKLIENEFSECSFVIMPRELQEVVKLIGRVKKVRGVRRVFLE